MDSSFVAALELVLAGIFLLAGLAKLIDLKSFRQSLGEFSVPYVFIPFFTVSILVLELMVGTTLLVPRLAITGAFLAVLMLIVFTGAILVQLAKGNAPHCHCFGQIDDRPIDRATIARNGVLVMIAGWILWQEAILGPVGGLGWLSDLTGFQRIVASALMVLFIVSAIEGWILLFLLQQFGKTLATRADNDIDAATDVGLPVGEIAPEFELPSTNQASLSLSQLRAIGLPLLLVFSKQGCTFCEELLPDLKQWAMDHGNELTPVLITSGDREYVDRIAVDPGLPQTLLQNGKSITQHYGVKGVPAAVFVSPNGRILSELAVGPPDIRMLVEANTGG
jgi:peroxiredoxin